MNAKTPFHRALPAHHRRAAAIVSLDESGQMYHAPVKAGAEDHEPHLYTTSCSRPHHALRRTAWCFRQSFQGHPFAVCYRSRALLLRRISMSRSSVCSK